MRRAALVLIVALGFGLSNIPAHSQSTAHSRPAPRGLWCYVATTYPRLIQSELSFHSNAAGQLVLRMRFSDGSGVLDQAVDFRAGAYWVRESPSGDHYHVDPIDGGLHIDDEDGAVGMARPIPPGQHCF